MNSKKDNNDEFFIKKTFREALKGKSSVMSNPLVGALIVKNGKIIERGYHKIFGGDHAEIDALKKCKKKVTGAILYVNLEPCCHFGKTGPCTKQIINAGIKKVVISNVDPNPLVKGKGIKELLDAGIEVKSGILSKEGSILNEKYFKYIKTKQPFVTLKAALSLDGKIFSEFFNKKYFTSLKSRKYVHKLRSENQAILVGINTVLKDNPELGVRYAKGKDPIRIILDSNLNIPLTSKVLRDKNVIIFTKIKQNKKQEYLTKKGFNLVYLKKLDPKNILKILGEKGISSLIIEGGSKIFSSFLKKNLIDKYIFFLSPKIFGAEKTLNLFDNLGLNFKKSSFDLKFTKIQKIDKDILIEAYNLNKNEF